MTREITATNRAAADADGLLPGGRSGGAIRRGQVVFRPGGPWTPSVHEVLRHLERVGFAGAPRVVGHDEGGREMLTYLPGRTVGVDLPWPVQYERAKD